MSIIPRTLGQQISDRITFLQGQPNRSDAVNQLLHALEQPQEAEKALTLLHELQRTYLAAKLGLLDNAAVCDAIAGDDFPLWDRYTELAVPKKRQQALAKLLYEGDAQRCQPILLGLCDYSRGIGELVLERCVVEQAEVNIFISDPLFQRRLMHHCVGDQVLDLANLMLEPYQNYERAITLRIEQTQQPFPDGPVTADVQQVYNAAVSAQQGKVRSQFYTLSVLPTPKDADLDGIPYDDYLDLFFRMIDVDWNKVDAAHQVLIAQLNKAKILRFTNNDGTDFSVNIDGFTFCNSLVAKNVPGSEVFSAPQRDSATGVVVGKGRYLFRGKLFENITLHFEQGRVVSYSAEKGEDVLRELIETDEGSHYLGEIAIGTNPVLRTHLVNGLLVEKIGGSFHFALGNCYKYDDYIGTPVMVNNDNNSAIHEDITIMLHGKQGRIYVDDQMIMEDGRFIDPALAYLNGVD